MKPSSNSSRLRQGSSPNVSEFCQFGKAVNRTPAGCGSPSPRTSVRCRGEERRVIAELTPDPKTLADPGMDVNVPDGENVNANKLWREKLFEHIPFCDRGSPTLPVVRAWLAKPIRRKQLSNKPRQDEAAHFRRPKKPILFHHAAVSSPRARRRVSGPCVSFACALLRASIGMQGLWLWLWLWRRSAQTGLKLPSSSCPTPRTRSL